MNRTDRLIADLCREEGLTEEQARALIPKLHRMRVLDIVFVDDEFDGSEADLDAVSHYATEDELERLSHQSCSTGDRP